MARAADAAMDCRREPDRHRAVDAEAGQGRRSGSRARHELWRIPSHGDQFLSRRNGRQDADRHRRDRRRISSAVASDYRHDDGHAAGRRSRRVARIEIRHAGCRCARFVIRRHWFSRRWDSGFCCADVMGVLRTSSRTTFLARRRRCCVPPLSPCTSPDRSGANTHPDLRRRRLPKRPDSATRSTFLRCAWR